MSALATLLATLGRADVQAARGLAPGVWHFAAEYFERLRHVAIFDGTEARPAPNMPCQQPRLNTLSLRQLSLPAARFVFKRSL